MLGWQMLNAVWEPVFSLLDGIIRSALNAQKSKLLGAIWEFFGNFTIGMSELSGIH